MRAIAAHLWVSATIETEWPCPRADSVGQSRNDSVVIPSLEAAGTHECQIHLVTNATVQETAVQLGRQWLGHSLWLGARDSNADDVPRAL